MTQAHVFVGPDGLLTFIYRDELVELLALGEATIDRASHVEPSPIGWTADMAPSNGPVLGPFPLRREALAAEETWIDAKLFGTNESTEIAKSCP